MSHTRRYKHFGRFQKPKLNVMVALNTPEAYASPNALVLTALYASMVEEELNE
jgi:secreted Zn-dependent insulinase-like peptidase